MHSNFPGFNGENIALKRIENMYPFTGSATIPLGRELPSSLNKTFRCFPSTCESSTIFINESVQYNILEDQSIAKPST